MVWRCVERRKRRKGSRSTADSRSATTRTTTCPFPMLTTVAAATTIATRCAQSFHREVSRPLEGLPAMPRRDGFETEMHVYYGTNVYNFEMLEDPARFRADYLLGLRRSNRTGRWRLFTVVKGLLVRPCTAKKHPGVRITTRAADPPR